MRFLIFEASWSSHVLQFLVHYRPTMDFFSMLLIILGLGLFETVSSIDNAIINAEVLSGMSPKARRWFLLWGILFAVFIVRGALPWLIVWGVTPQLGPMGSL